MLKLSVALSALSAMFDATEGNVSHYAVGNSSTEYKHFTGSQFWHKPDKPSMTKIYQQILFSSMEFSGAPHFDAPAEWQAAVIATFVHPANYMSACSWFVPNVMPAVDMAGLSGDVTQGVVALDSSPSQLFALVVVIQSSADLNVYKASFEKHVNASIVQAQSKKVRVNA